jgi:hypothetical protein
MYEDLSDEDKVLYAISFVARGTQMPAVLMQFLKDNGLYELITEPQEILDDGHSDKGPSG